MKDYKISLRAKTAVENELACFPDDETGGLLLGYINTTDSIYILEATDSGYKNVIHEAGRFKYDIEYELHICNYLSRLYNPPLQIVGVWHKHNIINKSKDLPFSSSDKKIHQQILENSNSCISILFEKEFGNDNEIQYNMRVYLFYNNGKHIDITDFINWD